MPDSSGPWDGAPWAEADWYRTMMATTPSGVHGTAPATSATAGSLAWQATGLTITPTIGRATVGGAGYSRTAALTSVSAAANTHASFSRRDRLVLRRNLSTHAVALTVLTGTPASSPVAPAITRDDTSFDLPLHSFLVPPASGTAISGVQDERVWINPYQPDSGAQVADATVRAALSTGMAVGATLRQADTGVAYEWRGGTTPTWWKVSGPLTLLYSNLNNGQGSNGAGGTSTITSKSFTTDAGGVAFFSGTIELIWGANAGFYYTAELHDSAGALVETIVLNRFHNGSTGFNVWIPFSLSQHVNIPSAGNWSIRTTITNDPASGSAIGSWNEYTHLRL